MFLIIFWLKMFILCYFMILIIKDVVVFVGFLIVIVLCVINVLYIVSFVML